MPRKRMQGYYFSVRLLPIMLEKDGPKGYILGLYAARKKEFNREEIRYE